MTQYTEDQMTGWYHLSEQTPWEVGVYEVQYPSGVKGCAYFNGNDFACGWVIGTLEQNIQNALVDMNEKECVQPIKWRGLNHNPDAPVKPKSNGNKRKVMYVVIDANRFGSFRGALAAFDNLKNAQEYAEYATGYVRIQKIRFRTPEHN